MKTYAEYQLYRRTPIGPEEYGLLCCFGGFQKLYDAYTKSEMEQLLKIAVEASSLLPSIILMRLVYGEGLEL